MDIGCPRRCGPRTNGAGEGGVILNTIKFRGLPITEKEKTNDEEREREREREIYIYIERKREGETGVLQLICFLKHHREVFHNNTVLNLAFIIIWKSMCYAALLFTSI